jgi:predicted extracellular nuclease
MGIRLNGAIGSIYAQTGYLDYALANPSLVFWTICTGIWYINADEQAANEKLA